MNLLQNRTMHPQLRDEEALVIENAIRLAIDSIINVLYSVNGARTREYERMLGVRDKEIRRLSGREKDFERELQLLRRQGCSCGLYDATDDHCGSGFPDPLLQNPDCGDPSGDPRPGCGDLHDPRPGFGDPRPGCDDAGDEMAAVHGQCEMTFSLGLFDASPSQVSAQSQDLGAAPPPAIRPSFQPTPDQPPPEAVDPLDETPALSNGPVIKEEPSDMDAICESTDLHGILGQGEMVGDFRGSLYPGPERLGLGGSEQHMMRRRNPPRSATTPDTPRARRMTDGRPPHRIGDVSETAEDMTPAVLAALPSLPEKKLQTLLNKLLDIGVESEEDLRFVRMVDLHDILTPLQCRKLLRTWRVEGEYVAITAADQTNEEFHPSSPSVTASSPPGGGSPNGSTLDLSSWPDNFVVPWTRMPACITTAIALNDRPSPKSRREMVRILVDQMRLKDLNPTRANCIAVAKKIVREYPNSFADVLRDGTRIGSGYVSLVTQIKTRVEHVNRGNTLVRHRRPKRPPTAPVEDAAARTPEPPAEEAAVRAPETDALLRRKQREMKELFAAEGPAAAGRGQIGPLMEATYPLQRQAVDACPPPPVVDLRADWPYLFTPIGLYKHFQLLTGVGVLEKMEQAVAEKGKLIISFFQNKPDGADTVRIQDILRRFESSEESAFGPCAILLLMAYLDEEVEGLILEADVLATAEEVEQALRLPDSPRLIVLGDMLTSRKWMLSMEGKVVVSPHPGFVAGVAALLTAYYAFNLAFQEGASCTLEFIQRCFLGLNPTHGTKVPSRKKKKDVHVSALLRRLRDFDWLFM
ncbi:uncharacterized protein LOC115545705 [Gadus morhua]|uniref:Uncharacterized LOC115545705 n=1 Tax=Gadus morhua TaxID=8049 RepID=A0A8C4ZWV6_GADMO|nr:uncharacterized protein LOC115545705 [Gadus morhua]